MPACVRIRRGARPRPTAKRAGLSRTSLPTAEDAEEEARATRDAAMDVERGMLQLHQIFLDVASAVERQGEVIDLVETRVGAAAAAAASGARALSLAREDRRRGRRRTLVGGGVAFAVVAIVVLVLMAGLVG